MYIILLSIIGGIIALGFGAEMIVRSSVNLANIYNASKDAKLRDESLIRARQNKFLHCEAVIGLK